MSAREKVSFVALCAACFLLLSGSLLVLVKLFSMLRVVTMAVLISLLLTTALMPLVRGLVKLRVPRTVAALLLVAGVLGLGVAGVRFFGPAATAQVGEALSNARAGGNQLLDGIAQALPVTRKQVDRLIALGSTQVEENLEAVGAGLLSSAAVALDVFIGLALIVVLLFFFLREGPTMFRWVVDRAPLSWRQDVRGAAESAWIVLTGYLRGSAIIATVDAVGIGVGLWIIGVPLVLPLALLTFLGGFFPIVGAFTAGIIAVLVALVTRGLTEALLASIVVICVQQLETNLLEPVVLGKAVPLHPVAIVLVIVSGSILGGVVGAFIAVPLAAMCVAIGSDIRRRHDPAFAAERAEAERARA